MSRPTSAAPQFAVSTNDDDVADFEYNQKCATEHAKEAAKAAETAEAASRRAADMASRRLYVVA